jgi:hypothetical protein
VNAAERSAHVSRYMIEELHALGTLPTHLIACSMCCIFV